MTENDRLVAFNRTLGGNIRRLRERRGLTQAALAEALRERGHVMQQQTVLKMEQGTRTVRAPELADLAVVLGVQASDLVADYDLELVAGTRALATRLGGVVREMGMAIYTEQVALRGLVQQRQLVGEAVDDEVTQWAEMDEDAMWAWARETLARYRLPAPTADDK